jgi:thiosulfate/3-mercaptopyruvate sulfurtransferase
MGILSKAAAGAVLLVLSALPVVASADDFGPLISADELVAVQSTIDPLILDIRGDTVEDGRIPNAVSARYADFRGPQENPGQLLTEEVLTTLFRRLGIEATRPTVIVHQGRNETDFGAAARVYWTLKSAGVSKLAILNGGMNAWTVDDTRPVSSDAMSPTPSTFSVKFNTTWLATREDVLEIVQGEGTVRLIDARPEAFYKGETAHPGAARPGTLPQSEYFTHSGWFAGGPAIIDAKDAQRLAIESGFKQGDALVSFCNTGHWAATNWFALSELAGIENVKLYPESLVGWSHAGLPMANTPGLIDTLWNKIKQSL